METGTKSAVRQPRAKPRILIVDDEPKLVHLVCEVMTAAGFDVMSTGSGERAVEMIAVEQPDLVLLDIILSKTMDGYQVARRAREFTDVPILMLTAKAREEDLLRGFESGADDYLTKPFSSKELLVRVRAMLKRARSPVESQVEAQIVCGDLQIDTARRRVTVAGRDVKLTKTEYELLHLLATNRNRVLLHEQLLTGVWGPEYRDDLEYLRAYILHLRRKLKVDESHSDMIATSPGVGYMLVCPDKSA